MLSLHDRLQGVVDILNDSNNDIELEPPSAHGTGFVPVPPEFLAEAVMELLDRTDTSKVSLDLGCGNGGWMLLCAAAGFASYGVELNPALISHAQRNYELAVSKGFIDPATPCAWTIGDMVPITYSKEYGAFRELYAAQYKTMPTGAVIEDSYARLPTTIATADIVYCWAWPTQSRFIFNMLQAEAKQGVYFVLPSYEEYTKGDYIKDKVEENLLHLTPIVIITGVYVGQRTE